MQGWIKLHRKLLENPIFYDPYLLKLWVYCLLKATHKEHKQIVGKQMVELQPGQFVTGRFILAEEYNKGAKPKDIVSDRTLWRWLKFLEECEFLSIKPTTKYSVVTINNWDKYQENVQQMSSKCPANVQQMSTNKNVKNVKNNNTRKQVYEDDSIYIMLAKYFVEQIKQNNPNFKEPNYQKWADDIRLMIERDNRTEEQIKYLMKWVQQDDFEMANVLSPSKLRKRFDQLVLKVKAQKQKNKAEHSIPTRTEIDFNEGEDWH
ncbi:replication protein [Caldifermentibacillus hisashii]|uniref:replication protein n=1 Tax=Caldifermentibacillus hisashii TaxID=996558 RepID=UPI001C11C3B3|nr:replication protein [Caldifermentibacillus hisashii]MBU5342319.1 replication protein [Caldifermentibacillus hisashii]